MHAAGGQLRLQSRRFAAGQVDDNQAVHAGPGAGGGKPPQAVRQQRVVVAHQYQRRGANPRAQGGGRIQAVLGRDAVPQGDMAGFLYHRPVAHRVAEWNAQFNGVGAGGGQLRRDFQGRVPVGMAHG